MRTATRRVGRLAAVLTACAGAAAVGAQLSENTGSPIEQPGAAPAAGAIIDKTAGPNRAASAAAHEKRRGTTSSTPGQAKPNGDTEPAAGSAGSTAASQPAGKAQR